VKAHANGALIKTHQNFAIKLRPLYKRIYLYQNIILWETKCN
jgi:hypothetical protein